MPEEHVHVLVVGSGAGGAPLTNTLVRANHQVLVLEKGPLFRPQYQNADNLSDFKRDETFGTGTEKRITTPGVRNQGDSYYSSHVEPDLNDEPHVYRDADGDRVTIEGYTAQVVGGGTQLYGGVSLRYTAHDFQLATFNNDRQKDLRGDPNGDVLREARDWPISYDDLEPYYCKAEELIGINGSRDGQERGAVSVDHYQPPLDPSPISDFVRTGLDALGMRRYRTPLAVITRDHPPSGRTVPADLDTIKTAFVNRYGDPLGLKSNTWVSLLSPLKDLPNFEIRANCAVTRLEAEGSRVTRAYYRDPVGNERTVTADVIVIACSAIESVRLLLLSAQADQNFNDKINGNGLLGSYFLTHCFGGAQCVVPQRADKSKTLDSDWASDHCAREDWITAKGLWAGGVIYNNTSDGALPISLARTWQAMDLDSTWKGYLYDPAVIGQGFEDYLQKNFGRRLSVTFMANQVPQRTNRIALHPKVTDKWGNPVAYIIKDWHSHDQALMETFAEQCHQILLNGGPAEDITFGSVESSVVRIANHVMGGARFGTDRQDSVLDKSCRAWNFDNLYVTDGAFMPTSGSANPTLTIQANSFRVAKALLDQGVV